MLRQNLVLLALLGCKHPAGAEHRKPDRHTTPTSPIPTETEQPRQPGPDLPPSATLAGEPGMNLGYLMSLVPAYGDAPSVLIMQATTSETDRATYGWPWTFLVPGNLPRGNHVLLDWWDGVSGHDESYAQFDVTQVAGDINDDGQLDLWMWGRLYLGPLLGQRLVKNDAHAWLPDYSELVVAANFDADGDGHEDMLSKDQQRAYVHYGPFAGEIPSVEVEDGPPVDPSTYSQLGGPGYGCSSEEHSAILRDHLGPGRDAVAVGVDPDGGCETDGYIWDLAVPRGTYLSYSEAVGSYDNFQGARMMDDAGDVDGDGYGDALWFGGGSVNGIFGYGVTSSHLFKGPITGENVFAGSDGWPSPVTVTNGLVLRGLSDINGDGQNELLGVWRPDPSEVHGRWVLMFSPHQDPLDLSTGLEIRDSIDQEAGLVDGDLDGDGLSELIIRIQGPEDASSVAIWYSSDLNDAWSSYQDSLQD